jgi:hypothetical protein
LEWHLHLQVSLCAFTHHSSLSHRHSEKLAVIATPRTDFVKEILKKFVNEDTLAGDAIKWDLTRGGDFRCIATVVYLLAKPFSALAAFPPTTQLAKWLSDPDEVSSNLRTKVTASMEVFVKLIKLPARGDVFISPKVAPVEVIGIALLISELREKMSLKKLCATTGVMRKLVRERHDKRVLMNSTVFHTMLSAIKDAGDTESDQPVSVSKRKQSPEDDDDGEYQGPAKKRSSSSTTKHLSSSSRSDYSASLNVREMGKPLSQYQSR